MSDASTEVDSFILFRPNRFLRTGDYFLVSEQNELMTTELFRIR